ncbi:MAG TPA: menaquinol oxidoreductase [Actinomycetota bacterium]|nr:menaquinol oxidoreductase [Actinomycetota bacterium]
MSTPEREDRYRLLGVVPHDVEPRSEHEPDDDVFTWPHLLVRHAVVAGLTVAVVFVLAILFDAPLKDIANPNQTPEVAKAPWYFAGLQELLSHVQPMVAGVIVPTVALLWLVFLPYLDRGTGWRIRDRKVVVVVFTTIAIAALVLTIVGTFFRGPGWTWVWPWRHLYVEL